jgi:phage terminase large subunit-like protein
MPCDFTTAYAADVVAGRIVTGKLVRQACKRHLEDLKTAGSRGLYWDPRAAEIVFKFMGLLRHWNARWVGKPFVLEPWQKFIVGSLFGWKRSNGRRRFKFAHVEVARKNGKTALASAIALVLLILDNEAGAEVYTVATKRDQARITHNYSLRMAKASPAIRRYVTFLKNVIAIESRGSKYEPLSADAHTHDGLSPSGAIMDELHAWKQRELWEVVETGIGARTQPMMVITTTAGFDQHGIWWERRQLAVSILAGDHRDDEVFAYIATLDEADDWTDPKVWIKANPNLGVTIEAEELAAVIRRAQITPGKQGAVKRLRLNVPTDVAIAAFDIARWDLAAYEFDEDMLLGRPCFSGFDLSSHRDLTALVHVFPPEDDDPNDPYVFLPRFFLPKEDIIEKGRQDGFDYLQAEKDGEIYLVESRIIEEDFVEDVIRADSEKFDIRKMAIDRWRMGRIGTRLIEAGLPIYQHGQGFKTMPTSLNFFEALLESNRVAQNGSKLFRWCIGNTAVEQDATGNRKPSKRRSAKRIDGTVAAIMACGAIIDGEDDMSIYDRGESLAL